jgi:hypothetical protein
MLNININIEKIDYLQVFKTVQNLTSKQPQEGENDLFLKILEIVAPFADKALAMIPQSAIAQLFNLLGKDKVLKLAKDFGVYVTDIEVTSQNDQ